VLGEGRPKVALGRLGVAKSTIITPESNFEDVLGS
jgi:hypothetical protein